MEEVLHIHIGYVHAHKGIALAPAVGTGRALKCAWKLRKKIWRKWCQQVVRMEEEVHSTWLWLGASGRTWAIHCSEDQTQITFNVTCPLVVHFLSNLLLNLCRVHTAAAAYCSLFPSESQTLLNQMPYEGYYFSIIILVNKTHNLLKKGNQVLFGKACFQQNQLVQHPLCFCHLFLIIKNFWVCWFVWLLAEDCCLPNLPAVLHNILSSKIFALFGTQKFPQYFKTFLNKINLSARSVSACCFQAPRHYLLGWLSPKMSRGMQGHCGLWLLGCIYAWSFKHRWCRLDRWPIHPWKE